MRSKVESISIAVAVRLARRSSHRSNKEVSTSTEVEKKLSFTLDPGQTRYVRTVVGLGFFVGRVYPELVDDATGQKEIEEASYIGPPLQQGVKVEAKAQ